jgi:hypothetical protein
MSQAAVGLQKVHKFGHLESRIEPVRASDGVLGDLVAERRKQVEAIQKSRAEQLAAMEAAGQERLQAFRAGIGKDNARMLQEFESKAVEDAKATEAIVKQIRGRLALPSAPSLLDAHPGFNRPQLSITAFAAAWVAPYYATLHGSDGSIYWQGYNPGTFTLSDWASGSGLGLFGTGAGSFTVFLDWWFVFRTDTSRFYSQNVYVPYDGYYIDQADQGWFTSKEAKVSIDQSAMGYQYNGKPTTSINLLSVDNSNINVNDRFDGWRAEYYSDLLGGGDAAYLLVSSQFYVYARGGGSFAELNFADGSANHIGIPYVYVS